LAKNKQVLSLSKAPAPCLFIIAAVREGSGRKKEVLLLFYGTAPLQLSAGF